MSEKQPTEAEWRVLSMVNEHGPCATRVVVELGGELGWSPSTVKTLLRRLVDKGLLKAKRIRNGFEYRTTRGAMRSLRAAADTLIERAGGDAVAPLLAYMVKRSGMSADELAELKALLDDAEKEL